VAGRVPHKKAVLIADILRGLFLSVIVLSVASVVLLPTTEPVWLDIGARVVAGLAAELMAVALLRQVLPRPTPGSHRIGKGEEYASWVLSVTLAEVALAAVVRSPFWVLRATRCLYLRALGADLAWSVSLPPDLFIRDPILLRIEDGARIDPGVRFETVTYTVGRINVGRVTVGSAASIGHGCMLMPGANVAHEARVGPAVLIGTDARIGVGASIGPRVVLGERVEIGSYAVIGAGVVIGEGARVSERARVLAGANVPPDTVIEEREIWPPGASLPAAPSSVSLRVVPD